MTILKDEKEIQALRDGGKILASVLQKVSKAAKTGVSTAALDKMAQDLIVEAGGRPSFLNYKTADDKRPYPASLCVSVNDEVVHGIPSGEKVLKDGDMVSFDIGMEYKGLYTDTACTVIVGGNAPKEVKEFLETAKKSLGEGIKAVRAGAKTGDIGNAVSACAEEKGFGVVRKLVGHGIGRSAHEDPEVPNFGKAGTGSVLEKGMVIAIEPMITFGNYDVYLDKTDLWTWKTKDGSLAAHFEHTVLVTENGAEIITKL